MADHSRPAENRDGLRYGPSEARRQPMATA